jgi:heme exporter protein CcmD
MESNMVADNLQRIFWLDGHGPYVWAAYGIVFLSFIFVFLQLSFKNKKVMRLIKEISQKDASTT